MCRALSCLALLAALGGCTAFPEVDAQVSASAKAAGYPALRPVEQLLAGTGDIQITEQSQSGLQGRVERLKARAARLQGQVIDNPTRGRMREAVQNNR